jgi:adenosylcobinamide-GDP ribazoletransferase
MQGARAALGLLSIIPVGASPVGPAARRAAPAWFPLVGALIGGAAAGTWVLVEPRLGAAYASVLALTVSGVLAGGLHHDGLADTADGLGARGGIERRLEAMRDPGIGAYGALALLAYALLSLTALSQLSPSKATAALICGHALGRWSALAQLALLPPARPDGLGATYGARTGALAIGSGLAFVIALASAGFGAGGLAVAGAVVAAVGTSLLAKRAIAGRTGDTLGASVLITEVVVYSLLAAY